MVSRVVGAASRWTIGRLAIALALAACACSSGSSSGDGGPHDAGPDGTTAVGDAPAGDARDDAGDAGDARGDAGDARDGATDAPAGADVRLDGADATANDATDARADLASSADAANDARADAGADLRADGAADAPADLPPGADAAGDAPAPTDLRPDGAADLRPDAAADAPADLPPGADAPADAPPARGCASPGNILCETFETTLPGGVPATSPWLDRPVFGICDSNSTLAVGAQAHGGARGLTSHSFGNQCVLEADLGVHPELWVRAWVRSDAPGPGQVDVSEMTLFGIGANQFGDDPRIAVGYAGSLDFSPCSHRPGISVNTTGSSPAAGCTGAPLPTDRWLCFELHVTQAGSTVHAELYLDGQQQTFVAAAPDAGTTTTVTNIYGASVRYLALGVRQYGSRYVTPAYYDDVAAGTARIGCSD